jgi:hypothetical protein
MVRRPTDNGDGRGVSAANSVELEGYTAILVVDQKLVNVNVSSSATSLSITVRWSNDSRTAELLIPGQDPLVVRGVYIHA